MARQHVTPFPHLWVTLATMAAATERVVLQPAFANNLFRHPVEFAQASLSMQVVSGGRFEAGLGAGWARDEMDRTGSDFPDGRTRARMFHEAVQIVREIVAGRPCRVHRRALPGRRPGARTAADDATAGDGQRRQSVDDAQHHPAGRSGRAEDGSQHAVAEDSTWASSPASRRDEVRQMVDTVRSGEPRREGEHAGLRRVRQRTSTSMKKVLGDGIYGSMVGEPAQIAESLLSLGELGIDRIQVSQWLPGSMTAVAPFLQR